MCKALTKELFSTNDFGNWATEKLVRLKIDADQSWINEQKKLRNLKD